MKTVSLLLLALPAAAFAPIPQSQISGRVDDRATPGTLTATSLRAMLNADDAHTPFVPETPLGIQSDLGDFIPEDNPLTPAKVELGRQLYFDKRLSRDNTISCATCHDPAMGWTDNAPVSTGIEGQTGGRSAPTVINRILSTNQFWDGRAASLEEQALGPVANPIEMGFTHDEAVARLNEIPLYKAQFEAVFGGPATADGIAKAIAAFERTILSGRSKNDYYEAALPFFDYEPEDDEDPAFLERMNRALDLESEHRMSPAAERGRELFFGKANCSACHVGENLTDEDFHNLGIGFEGDQPDQGRRDHTADEADHGKFRTPTVRDIALTAPYMHDGSLKTLMEVVEHYDKGGTKNDWLDPQMFPLKLSEAEKQDLVRFMEEALSGEITYVEVPRLP